MEAQAERASSKGVAPEKPLKLERARRIQGRVPWRPAERGALERTASSQAWAAGAWSGASRQTQARAARSAKASSLVWARSLSRARPDGEDPQRPWAWRQQWAISWKAMRVMSKGRSCAGAPKKLASTAGLSRKETTNRQTP